MSTSAYLSYSDPSRSPFMFSGRACFGTLNRLESSDSAASMENLEWHPSTSDQDCVNNAFDIINSFGMWKNVYWKTPIKTVAASVRENPADQIITGLMAMRDLTHEYYGMYLTNNSSPIEDQKLDFIMSNLFYYWNRMDGVYRRQNSTEGNGESSVFILKRNTDAFALHLLLNGTEQDFEGCWPQGLFGEGDNVRGYLRDSSHYIDRFRRNNPQISSNYYSMADWLHAWLETNPTKFEGKLGRLTVQQFCDRINMRASGWSNTEQVLEGLKTMFEELKDMYL